MTTTADPSVPPSQFWSQNSLDVLDSSEANDNFGWSLAAGDFNHDGFSDLAIGVPGEVFTTSPGDILGTPGTGAVQILYDSAAGLTAAGNQLFANPSPNSKRFGDSMVWADFNGDTFGDLAVEAQRTTGDVAGLVSIFFGNRGGLSPRDPQQLTFTNVETFTETGPIVGLTLAAGKFNNDHFGEALTVGDLNGDGKDNLAVGVPHEDIGTTSDAGAVNVIYGSNSGLLPARQSSPFIPASQLFAQNNSAIPGEGGAENGDHFGAALAANDFNNDGFADLAIGVPDEDINNNTISNAGVVNVIYGSSTGVRTGAVIPPQLWHQDISGIKDTAEAGDRFGATLTAWNFGKFSNSPFVTQPLHFKKGEICYAEKRFKQVPCADCSNSGRAGWGRVAPQGCPGVTAGAGCTASRLARDWGCVQWPPHPRGCIPHGTVAN